MRSARFAITALCVMLQLLIPSSGTMGADESSQQKLIEADVRALDGEDSAIRSKAATELRELLSKTGGLVPGEKDEAFWITKLKQITIGLPKAEVDQLLPPQEGAQMSIGQGMRAHSVKCRLSNYWEATLNYDATDKIAAPPTLHKSERNVWVPPAPDFSGQWTTYFVNGQKASDIEYKDGEYNGLFVSYYANGKKCYEQHYVNGVAEGSDVGWHDNGKPSYAGQYVHGKQDGTWTWWNADGTKRDETVFKMGTKAQ